MHKRNNFLIKPPSCLSVGPRKTGDDKRLTQTSCSCNLKSQILALNRKQRFYKTKLAEDRINLLPFFRAKIYLIDPENSGNVHAHRPVLHGQQNFPALKLIKSRHIREGRE